MKINYRKMLFISLLLMPTVVFASTGNESISVDIAIIIEAFCTLHVSIFFLKPLSYIISEKNSRKTFWILFFIRIAILLFFDYFITTGIWMVDGLAIMLGCLLNVYMDEIKKLKKKESNTTPLDTTKKPLLPSNFDPIYNLPENKMVEEVINKELKNAGVDLTTELIPSDLLKKKHFLNIMFSILVFVYISLIFFHFPIYTYVIGLIILFIIFKITRNYNLINYVKKQLKLRPSEKIINVIMNIKNSFVLDNSKNSLTISLLVVVVLSLMIFSTPKIIYEKTDGGYAVRYYIFGLTNFKTATIPETYKNEKIVSLRGNTFSNMFFLKKVNLPDSIIEIRGQAFKNCKRLVDVNIPSKLEYLGGGAFSNAQSIKIIELPDTLTYLGGESFYGAKSLEYVKLSNNLSEIRGSTFESCISLKGIVIPDNVTRIGAYAFYGDSSLSMVSISENSKLLEIGSSAFRQCISLYNITIPSETLVNERAFKESSTFIYRYRSSFLDER